VRLEEFAIRRGSGGAGQWRGGDGARRRIRFLRPMQAIVVASRRNVAPHGLAGGLPGDVGRQWVERADGRIEPIPGNSGSAMLGIGDALVVETPGGGGYGPPRDPAT
jgi:5-oxoprolinase (ATP-hydrolysing)